MIVKLITKKKLSRLISKYDLLNLEFSGSSDSIQSELNNLDIFLFTSKSESSPISVWEAMMMGLPIVSYRVGDVDKYILDDLNGFTADVFDKKKLITGINKIIEQNLSSKMGGKSIEIAHKYFSSKKCAQLHLEFIESLVSGFHET